MKRLMTWMILAAICLWMAAPGQVQPAGSAARALPARECKAIEQYIAHIDSARSIRDKGQRDEKYAEAQAGLKEALRDRDDPALLAQASEYAKITEQVATIDPADAKLSDILDKKLNLRSALLERCEDYTATR